MKNTINIATYLKMLTNLILNTYRCLFFQTASESLQCCLTASAIPMPCKTSQQDSVEMERFWNLQRSNFVNHNGAKMIEVSNSNKLTEVRTKMEVVKLRTTVAQD